LVNGTTTVHYQCGFYITLYAEVSGTATQIGFASCFTTSFAPESLTCSATASGVVP
jgi:hypothetical protein